MRPSRLLLLFGSLTGAALAALAAIALLMQPACSPGQCTQSLLDPNEPSSALECAAGLVCYQGQCIKACSAGQERGADSQCKDDGECDGSRPNCIDGYCSACQDGEFCVPTLNICQPITEVDLMSLPIPPVPQPGSPKPPEPLDGGWIDGGLRLDKDAGTTAPADAVVAVAGLIDIANFDSYFQATSPDNSKVTVRVFDTSNVVDTSTPAKPIPGLVWRVDPWDDTLLPGPYPPASEMIIEEVLGEQCTLSQLTAYPDLNPISIGDITIDDAPSFPGSLKARTEVPYDGSDYVVPIIERQLLIYSQLTPSAPRFISISGDGSDVTSGSWPSPAPENGEHVPFKLEPSADTLALLQNGATVAVNNGQVTADLVVRWNPIRAGVVPGETITLRFRSAEYEVNCRTQEGNVDGAIIVKAGLLQSFIGRATLPPNTQLPLYFERAFARRTDIQGEEEQVLDVAIRVRHTIIGTIIFP